MDVGVGDELFWYIFEREPRARHSFVEPPDVRGLGLTVNEEAHRDVEVTE